MLRTSLSLLLAGLSTSAAFEPCCAYGGSGDAVLLGAGVLNAFAPPPGSTSPAGPSYAAPMAVGVSGAGRFKFSTVLFGARTGPEDAVAGWIVTSNATNDVIFVFSNASSTGPQCSAGVGPLGSMVPEYALCAGSGLFPRAVSDYKLAGLAVGVFAQAREVGASSACRDGRGGALAAVNRLGPRAAQTARFLSPKPSLLFFPPPPHPRCSARGRREPVRAQRTFV